MSYVIVYVILHVNGHISADFLHKHERINEHPRLFKKKNQKLENQSTRFVSSIVLPHSFTIPG